MARTLHTTITQSTLADSGPGVNDYSFSHISLYRKWAQSYLKLPAGRHIFLPGDIPFISVRSLLRFI